MYALVGKSREHLLSIELQLYLFDILVLTILTDKCEVWGHTNTDVIDKVQLTFCKHMLGVKTSTMNAMVLGELGRYPLSLQ